MHVCGEAAVRDRSRFSGSLSPSGETCGAKFKATVRGVPTDISICGEYIKAVLDLVSSK